MDRLEKWLRVKWTIAPEALATVARAVLKPQEDTLVSGVFETQAIQPLSSDLLAEIDEAGADLHPLEKVELLTPSPEDKEALGTRLLDLLQTRVWPAALLGAKRLRAFLGAILRGILATVRAADRLLGKLVGEENTILRSFLRVVVSLGVIVLAGLGVRALLMATAQQPSTASIEARQAARSAEMRLHLQSIPPQSVAAGKPLVLVAAVENADAWKGLVRYGLVEQSPPEAAIDAENGEFSWTPPPTQAAGEYDVTVSVTAPDGRKDHTSFTIRVTKPIPVIRATPPATVKQKPALPPLKLKAVSPQRAEIGRPLTLTLTLEDAAAWEGKVHFTLGPGTPPGATIDAERGVFTWTPTADQAVGEHDVTVLGRSIRRPS